MKVQEKADQELTQLSDQGSGNTRNSTTRFNLPGGTILPTIIREYRCSIDPSAGSEDKCIPCNGRPPRTREDVSNSVDTCFAGENGTKYVGSMNSHIYHGLLQRNIGGIKRGPVRAAAGSDQRHPWVRNVGAEGRRLDGPGAVGRWDDAPMDWGECVELDWGYEVLAIVGVLRNVLVARIPDSNDPRVRDIIQIERPALGVDEDIEGRRVGHRRVCDEQGISRRGIARIRDNFIRIPLSKRNGVRATSRVEGELTYGSQVATGSSYEVLTPIGYDDKRERVTAVTKVKRKEKLVAFKTTATCSKMFCRNRCQKFSKSDCYHRSCFLGDTRVDVDIRRHGATGLVCPPLDSAEAIDAFRVRRVYNSDFSATSAVYTLPYDGSPPASFVCISHNVDGILFKIDRIIFACPHHSIGAGTYIADPIGWDGTVVVDSVSVRDWPIVMLEAKGEHGRIALQIDVSDDQVFQHVELDSDDQVGTREPARNVENRFSKPALAVLEDNTLAADSLEMKISTIGQESSHLAECVANAMQQRDSDGRGLSLSNIYQELKMAYPQLMANRTEWSYKASIKNTLNRNIEFTWTKEKKWVLDPSKGRGRSRRKPVEKRRDEQETR
ncbi:hypothetical protein B0H16DRAFT_1469454 [Mycena metata]|uniref:Uncharacterized protein n=1 Tax=Mycena metata TaxID=1033252 RepID=A0AAD7HZF2_9AGAR|nr:hypothetical protein B0H16DRAFT_1469454 [Mycena metata]